jgi:hypothetical protein
MPSEMRRAAKALVETRVETFESLHPLEASQARIERALAGLGGPRAFELNGAWTEREGRVTYEATFRPAPRTQRFLNAMALVLVLLMVACAWVLSFAKGTAPRFLFPFVTVLAVAAMPLVVNAAASRREAEEARIRRAIRAALQGKDPALPPAHRWADEE